MATTKTNETPDTKTRTVEELEALLAEKEKQLAELAAKQEQEQAAAPTSAYVEDAEALNRKVQITLPISGSNKEPLFVRVNDKTFTIMRGKPVSLPYYVWLHLQESMQADDALAIRMSELSGSFANGLEMYRM